jgi:signal peptidase I
LDFALILVLATGITGLIWLIDAALFARGRRESEARGEAAAEPVIVEYAKSFFPVLLLVLILRSFLFEPFRIPSGSMMPTLVQGDFIFVNKFSYGLRLPVLNTKIVDIGHADRGDVVVFKYPSDPSINYIKRVIGLPGDVVVYDPDTKELSINDEVMVSRKVGRYEEEPDKDLVLEDLGDVEHEILLPRYPLNRGGRFVVPEGHYFMMGDNRNNSQDSRYSDVGYVSEDLFVGKAELVWMSWRSLSEGGPRWGRIGSSIK